MIIGSIIPESSIDYPEKYGPVFFTSGCNYKCPACHNPNLIDNKLKIDKDYIKNIIKNIKYKKNWYTGIAISGGEPTIQINLLEFLKELKKETGLPIKLDTNGSNYSLLENLLEERLVDYVSLDIKGPREIYNQLIGKEYFEPRDGIEKAMSMITRFPDYEFRTTVVPVIRDPKESEISFLTVEEMIETTKWIEEITGNNHKYFLQKFVPSKQGLLNKRLESFPETPEDLINKIDEEIKKIIPKCKIR